MKRLLWSIAALLVAVNVFAQNDVEIARSMELMPTTLKQLNVKGNIYAYLYAKFEYKDYFGELQEGDRLKTEMFFFDKEGRLYLHRRMAEENRNIRLEAISYEYDDNGSTKINKTHYTTMAYHQKHDFNECYEKLCTFDRSFEELMESADERLSNLYGGEYILDENGVMISHTVISPAHSKILAKEIGKPTGTPGVFDFVLYDEYSKVHDKSQRTFKNGLLVKVEREYKVARSSRITTPDNGTYAYNKDGRLILKTSPDGNHEIKYEYNNHGDFVRSWSRTKDFANSRDTTGKWREWIANSEHYDDYKYDDQGNWIYRTYWDKDSPKFIEKRAFVYNESE